MTERYWVIGGDYADAAFARLVPGTERMVGPFADARRARTEWTRLSRRPTATATTRFAITTERLA